MLVPWHVICSAGHDAKWAGMRRVEGHHVHAEPQLRGRVRRELARAVMILLATASPVRRSSSPRKRIEAGVSVPPGGAACVANEATSNGFLTPRAPKQKRILRRLWRRARRLAW